MLHWGNLECGKGGSGLHRARGHSPPKAGPSAHPLVHATRCAILTGVVINLILFQGIARMGVSSSSGFTRGRFSGVRPL